jgi:Ca2+-binding RTX toxin-like protein
MSDILKFDITTTPITRYEYDDGAWTIDTLHNNETLALNGTSVVLTKTFYDRIKTVTYTLTDANNSLYTQRSEAFTTLDEATLSSPTAHVSTGEDGEDIQDGHDNNGSGTDTYHGSADDDFRDGGLGNDDIDGGEGDDELWGGEGNDVLLGGSGSDILLGEVGNDDLDGELGDDDLNGGAGDDTLVGGDGNDLLTGGSGIDSLDGGVGDDYLYAGSGNDTVDGGEGDDTIVGGDGAGNDRYIGGTGTDTIKYASSKAGIVVNLGTGKASSLSRDAAGIGQDTLSGIENVTAGSFGDKLYGNEDSNSLSGEKGNDLLQGGAGIDTLDGGDGEDTADYSDKTAAVEVTLNGSSDAIVMVGGIDEDTIKNIENITAGSGDDSLIGDVNANKINSGAGDDFLSGGSGKDQLDGGSGIDTADYSDKTYKVEVTLNVSKSSTVKVNGIAEDSIKNIENITTGSGDDVLKGDLTANQFSGGDGNDLLNGGLGNDVLTGGSGNDKFVFNTKLNPTTNLDEITDFVSGEDKIGLSKSIFGSLKTGVISDNVVTGSTSDLASHVYDKNDYLRFDTTDSKLYYDADGSGIKYKAVAIVELTGVSSLQALDIIVV